MFEREAGSATVVLTSLSPSHRRWSKVHSLAISGMFLVPSQNFLVTLSFDNVAHVLDSLSGSVFMTIQNQNRTRFTGGCWDQGFEQMVLADAKVRSEATS